MYQVEIITPPDSLLKVRRRVNTLESNFLFVAICNRTNRRSVSEAWLIPSF